MSVKQVLLNESMAWCDIIQENNHLIVAKDTDGVSTYVIKDGTEKTREKQDGT